MNKNKRSIIFSLIFTGVFTALLFFLTFTCPFTVRALCEYFNRMRLWKFLVIIAYAAVPAGWGAIYCLFRLLLNIRNDIVFDKKNVKLLTVLSWLCIYVGMISAVATYEFVVFAVISLSAFFVGLIVRVVKGIISKAIEIKEENELTI